MTTATKPRKPAKPRIEREVDTIDHATQQPEVKKALPNYAALGHQLYDTVQNARNDFRAKIIMICEQVNKDLDGYKAVAEAYANCYTNKDTAKNMKSALLAIFRAYVADSETMLASFNDDSKFYPDWRKDATSINGKTQSGRKAKEALTDRERDDLTDKIENYATAKDAEVIIDHSLGKLNGEMRFALIHKLMEATIADEHAEGIFKAYAGEHIGEVHSLLMRVYNARKQAEETTDAVKNNLPVPELQSA
jgi:hypothetical protein